MLEYMYLRWAFEGHEHRASRREVKPKVEIAPLYKEPTLLDKIRNYFDDLNFAQGRNVRKVWDLRDTARFASKNGSRIMGLTVESTHYLANLPLRRASRFLELTEQRM